MSQSNNKTKRLVLLDAHAIIHRAYHALPDFATTKGEPTGALYGISTMVMKIVEDLKPDYIVAAYDVKGPTYRHEVYKEYKAGRRKAEDDLISQLIRSRDIFTALDIPIYDRQGFEADDILGTIVEQLKNTVGGVESGATKDFEGRFGRRAGGGEPAVRPAGRNGVSRENFVTPDSTGHDTTSEKLEIIIASGDMDTLQLVSGEDVKVYTLKKGLNDTIMYDEKAVRARYGFGPELVPDYKGLRGDPSDNIPGIKGVGEKTATILISTFGSIESIYAELDAGHDEKFAKAGISPRLIQLLKDNKEEAEFSKMLATIRRNVPIDFKLPEKTFRETVEPKKIKALWHELEFRTLGQRLDKVLGGGVGIPVSINTNQSSLSTSDSASATTVETATSVDFGVAKQSQTKTLRRGEEGVVPLETNTLAKNEQKNVVLEKSENIEKVGIALWLINSNTTNPTLEDILAFANTEDFAVAGKEIFEELDKKGLRKVYEEIELPLIPIIKRMDERGVKIDRELLTNLAKTYHTEADSLQKKIWQAAGTEFNVSSPKQLGEILFDKLGLSTKNQKKTAGGARSTRESELEKLRDLHPIVPMIFEYRELTKLLSTYIDAIPPLLDSNDRLHTHYIQTGTTTGRMASQNPNLQNIPIKSALGRAIRGAFVAEKGFKLVALDYSQIELRIAAFLSGDEKMIEIFKKGEDVHTSVASFVFQVPANSVTPEMRRQAKVINFGIIYGMGVLALKQNLGTSRDDAQKFYNDYFATFSTLASYLDRIKKETSDKGYTETFFGRRRYFEGIRSKLPFIRAAAERMAINAPIQGTEADIIKLAMIKVDEYLQKEKLERSVYPILQVHDELVYEVKEDMAEKVAQELKKIMESIMDPKDTRGIPLTAQPVIGDNWGELK